MPNALERANRNAARAITPAPKPGTSPNEFPTSLADYDKGKASTTAEPTTEAPEPAKAEPDISPAPASGSATKKRQTTAAKDKAGAAPESPQEGAKPAGKASVAPQAPGSASEPAKAQEPTPAKPATNATPAPAKLLDPDQRETLKLLLETATTERTLIDEQNDELLNLYESQTAAVELTQKNMLRLEIARTLNVATIKLLTKLYDATK
jgi:hypothetical protein